MSDYDKNQECDGICLMSLDVLSFADGGRFDVPAAVHPGCPRHDPDPVREMIGPVLTRRIAEFDPGRWPILVAADHAQGAFWADTYQLAHRHVVAVGNSRALRGVQPTSVLYAPGWYLSRYIAEIADTLAALLAKQPNTPVHYILEGRF